MLRIKQWEKGQKMVLKEGAQIQEEGNKADAIFCTPGARVKGYALLIPISTSRLIAGMSPRTDIKIEESNKCRNIRWDVLIRGFCMQLIRCSKRKKKKSYSFSPARIRWEEHKS